MPVEILHPWSAGAAAVVALAIAWAMLRSGWGGGAPARSAHWRVVCLLLPGIAAVAALLAGAGITLDLGASAARSVVLLLDISGSARASPWRDPQWVRRLALNRLAPSAQDHLTVLGFARQPRLLLDDVSARDPGRWPSAWTDFGTEDGTNPTAALAWRAPDETARNAAPRWLITDGLFRWPQENTPAAATVIEPRGDAAITDMLLRDGALWLQVRACPGAAARDLVIRRNGQPLTTERLTFADDRPRTLWLNVPTPPGAADYEAHLTPDSNEPDADLWPENDRARLIAPVPETPRVLTLHAGQHLPGDASKLASQGWQVIELRDLSADDLGRWEWQALDMFVRDTGGGVILTGANHAFGPGGYGGEPIVDALLPVWSGPHNAAPATIIFLMDASASMNEAAQGSSGGTSGSESKFHVAARGVKAAMQLLAPDDHITVITFNGSARVAAEGTQHALDTTIDRSLATIEPAGGTLPDSALPLAAQALSTAPGDRKLVLLLTDGQVPAMDAPAWQKMLDAGGARFAIVAPATARTGPLATLAAHATWLDGNDPASWPALFRQAVAPIASGRPRTDPLRWSTQGTPRLMGTSNAWTETWSKPESTLLASGHAVGGPSWPAAAVAQRGLGRVAALPLAPDDPNSAALLDQLVHDVPPAPGDRRFALAAARNDAAGWTVTADGINAGKFLDGESLVVRIPDPATHQLRDVPMSQTGPGHYVASVPSAAGAIVLRTAPVEKNESPLIGRLQAPSLASDEWPASTEAGPIPPGITMLAPTDQGPPWQPRTHKNSVDLSPWLWSLAAISALAALWGRRSARR